MNLRLFSAFIFMGLATILVEYISTGLSAVVKWAAVASVMVIVSVLLAWPRPDKSRLNRRLIRVLHDLIDISTSRSAETGSVFKLTSGLDPELQEAAEQLKEVIRELWQDKRHAEMVLAYMADGIIAVDSDGRITTFNQAAEVIFQRRASEVVGSKIDEVDLHPEVARLAFHCITEGGSREAEVKLPGLPPRVIGIFATSFPTGDAGRGWAMIILHDLTELRRHESNQKEFVSNVSHELRTPLTAVRTTAEVLLNGAKNDEDVVDRFLGTILSESDRLSALIEDLMEIAKRDSGIIKTDKAWLRTVDVVGRAVDVVRPQAEAKNVAVHVYVPDHLMSYCDEMQTVQLLRNLADNAVKYTHEGGRVDIEAEESGSDSVITVRDTGIGIPQGEVDRIFERFYRVDKARSRRLGGTGLGLAIVKDIVTAHGGSIQVETQLGKGSKFIVSLPGDTEDRLEQVAK